MGKGRVRWHFCMHWPGGIVYVTEAMVAAHSLLLYFLGALFSSCLRNGSERDWRKVSLRLVDWTPWTGIKSKRIPLYIDLSPKPRALYKYEHWNSICCDVKMSKLNGSFFYFREMLQWRFAINGLLLPFQMIEAPEIDAADI